MTKNIIQLSTLIAEPFYEVHNAIWAEKCTHYWLKGGRGSIKSSFCILRDCIGHDET